MAINAPKGDEFRVPCACGVMFTTLHLPVECPDCGATVYVISRKPRRTKGSRPDQQGEG